MPSTVTPSKPYARARSASCSQAYSRCVGVEYAHWLLSQTNTTGSWRTPAKFIASWVSLRADAPSPNQPTATRGSSADAEGERAADDDRKHRRQVADDRDLPAVEVAEVDVPVPTAGGPVDAAEVVGEDPPRLGAAVDVDADVAVQRRADVLGRHRGGHADRGGLVAAPGVERAGDLPLLVERVPGLLQSPRDEHGAVETNQRVAREAEVVHRATLAHRLGACSTRSRC